MPSHTHQFNQPITAEQIRAMRKASCVCFRYQKNRDYQNERVGIIECQVEGKLHGKNVETYINVEVNTLVIDNDRMTDRAVFETFNHELECFESFGYAKHSDEWQTVTANLKAGDIITLCWERNNNSENLEDKEMATDSLKLKISRGDKRLSFLLFQSTHAKHSANRMVRYHGWAETQFVSRCWRKEHEYATA